jgi:hypothetical protein
MNLIINNQEIFQSNSSPVHNTNTKNKHHLHRPNSKLSGFQESTLYAGIPSLTILKNHKAKFKEALRQHLITHSFYHVDEFLVKKGVIILFL